MENFDLNFMNGVELTYCLDKYARGTVTIEIQNGETKLKDVDKYSIDDLKELLGLSTESNFYTIDDVKDHFNVLKSKYPKL